MTSAVIGWKLDGKTLCDLCAADTKSNITPGAMPIIGDYQATDEFSHECAICGEFF
jgi:hypothetical protein